VPVIRDGIADPARDRRVIAPAVVTMALAVLALLSPLSASEHPVTTVGWLLGTAAGIEALQGRRLATAAARRHATVSAAISMMIALLLINAPFVATAALTIVVAGWFGLDVLRNGIHFFQPRGENRWPAGAAALGNLAVVLLLLFARGWILTWVVTIAGALRIAGIAWNILVAPNAAATEAYEDVIAELGLRDDPEAVSMAEEIDAAQHARAPIDVAGRCRSSPCSWRFTSAGWGPTGLSSASSPQPWRSSATC
jgi:uncharacterized membrane protein HdeD (DUF308 family)